MPKEILTPTEFDDRLIGGELALTLVGMSNLGKSYWSQKLAEDAGFSAVCIDDMIENWLGGIMAAQGFKGGIAEVSRWMGQPYDPQFAENQQTYLDLETQATESTLRVLGGGFLNGNTVIDTTGSVVHTPTATQQAVKAATTVVYLEATPEMTDAMLEKYLAEPKPVVWGSVYDPKDTEKPDEALARCYPELLAARALRYVALADVVIPAPDLRAMETGHDFLYQVRENLPKA